VSYRLLSISAELVIPNFGNDSHLIFDRYIVFLSWFHFSEYFFTEITKPGKAKISSFMLNHSPSYNIALAVSIFEFLFERYFCQGECN